VLAGHLFGPPQIDTLNELRGGETLAGSVNEPTAHAYLTMSMHFAALAPIAPRYRRHIPDERWLDYIA
jgi:hypothetical protein